VFEVRVEVDFPAGHHLVGYPGDCAQPHGHNWKMEVFVRASELDHVGMAVDFRSLKGATQEIVAGWDHQDLNTHADFAKINPTAENLARLAYEKLSAVIDSGSSWVDRVRVWENDRCFAAYWDENKRRV